MDLPIDRVVERRNEKEIEIEVEIPREKTELEFVNL